MTLISNTKGNLKLWEHLTLAKNTSLKLQIAQIVFGAQETYAIAHPSIYRALNLNFPTYVVLSWMDELKPI